MSPGQNSLTKYWQDIFVSILSLRRSFRVCDVRLCTISWATPILLRRFTFLVRGWFMLEGGGSCWRRKLMLEGEGSSWGPTCTYSKQGFVIGWENNRDGDITMPLSLKTIGSAGYKDQWNKKFGGVQVNRMLEGGRRFRRAEFILGGGDCKRESLECRWFLKF